MDWSPPGSSVREIFQARILEWVAIPFSRGSFQPRDQTLVSCIGGRFFTDWSTREAQISCSIPGLEPLGVWSLSVLSNSLWKPTYPHCALDYDGRGYGYRSQAQKFHLLLLSLVWLFYDPMDCSPPVSAVHEIFQSRILGWVAISFSRGSSRLGDWTGVSCLANQREHTHKLKWDYVTLFQKCLKLTIVLRKWHLESIVSS